ncbi:MAG: TetR/AcrR family transcriptional regulator [Geminicoccaceae bacterium]
MTSSKSNPFSKAAIWVLAPNMLKGPENSRMRPWRGAIIKSSLSWSGFGPVLPARRIENRPGNRSCYRPDARFCQHARLAARDATDLTMIKRVRRGSNDPAAMRRRVLDVAAAAFHTRGYHATSTHDIMREAGVTGGALHHHYPTKKLLGLAVIRDRVAQAVEETWIEPIRTAPTAAAGIRKVFEQLAATIDARGTVLGCPLNNLALELALADPEFQQAVQSVFERWQTAIAQKLRADQAAGVLKKVDPEGVATFIVAASSGAMAMAKANQRSEPLGTCAQQLAAFLQPGLRKFRR